MEESQRYETFLRSRITELRVRKDVSEHRMSLDLGKSGSYIRSITNGMSLPSLRELFNIISYAAECATPGPPRPDIPHRFFWRAAPTPPRRG